MTQTVLLLLKQCGPSTHSGQQLGAFRAAGRQEVSHGGAPGPYSQHPGPFPRQLSPSLLKPSQDEPGITDRQTVC